MWFASHASLVFPNGSHIGLTTRRPDRGREKKNSTRDHENWGKKKRLVIILEKEDQIVGPILFKQILHIECRGETLQNLGWAHHTSEEYSNKYYIHTLSILKRWEDVQKKISSHAPCTGGIFLGCIGLGQSVHSDWVIKIPSSRNWLVGLSAPPWRGR